MSCCVAYSSSYCCKIFFGEFHQVFHDENRAELIVHGMVPTGGNVLNRHRVGNVASFHFELRKGNIVLHEDRKVCGFHKNWRPWVGQKNPGIQWISFAWYLSSNFRTHVFIALTLASGPLPWDTIPQSHMCPYLGHTFRFGNHFPFQWVSLHDTPHLTCIALIGPSDPVQETIFRTTEVKIGDEIPSKSREPKI